MKTLENALQIGVCIYEEAMREEGRGGHDNQKGELNITIMTKQLKIIRGGVR